MFTTRKITRKLRERRNERELAHALRTASPAMRQELMAAAARDFIH
jgi:hypothetical protein